MWYVYTKQNKIQGSKKVECNNGLKHCSNCTNDLPKTSFDKDNFICKECCVKRIDDKEERKLLLIGTGMKECSFCKQAL